MSVYGGPYEPHTGCTSQCINHAPAIVAALVLVVSIIVANFHLCSLLGTLSRGTVLIV